jgi:GNAT superfamily N-acetyltransferase
VDLWFEHTENADLHFLHAHVEGDPNQAGVISWSKKYDGAIFEADVRPEYQRQGVATALWNEARKGEYLPLIRMSPFHVNDACRDWGISVSPHEPLEWDMSAEGYWARLDRARAEGEWA